MKMRPDRHVASPVVLVSPESIDIIGNIKGIDVAIARCCYK